MLPAKKETGMAAFIVFLLGFLFAGISANAQTNIPPKYTKRTFSFIPSEVDKVNGLAFGAWLKI